MKNVFVFFLLIASSLSCKQQNTDVYHTELSKPVEFETYSGNKAFRTTLITAKLIDFNKYLSYLNDQIIGIPVSLVFFIESKIIGSRDINLNEIAGISVYQVVNNELQQNLFLKKNGKFVEQKEFSLNTPIMGLGQLTFLYNEIEKAGIKINSYLAVFPQKFPNPNDWSVHTRNDLSLHLTVKKYADSNLGRTPGQRMDEFSAYILGSSACQIPACHYEHGCDCAIFNAESDVYQCDPCVCLHPRIIGDEQVINYFTPLFLSTYFSANDYEIFRDTIMSKYAIGLKYKDYYYAVSTFLNSTNLLTSTDYIYIVTRMPDIKNIVNKLTNPASSPSAYLLSPSELTSLNEIVSRLSGKTDNTDFQAILSDISDDIDYFSNKSVSTVISEIE